MRDTERDGKDRENSNVYYNETTRDTKWTPWLITVIVAANVAIFIVVMFVNDCPKKSTGTNGECFAKFLRRFSFQPLRENPLLGPSSPTLDKWGALVWKKVVHENQGWRLLSCMWLHAGLIHLLANMFSLLIIGIPLEQQFGFLKVGLVYLISGYGGSILSALFLQNGVSVGASGALFGLLGAMLSELLTNWTIYANKARALFTLLFFVALNLALGLLPRVDNFAHIGGFLTGFLLGFIILIRPQFGWEMSAISNSQYGVRVKPKYNACQYVLFLLALVFVVVGLAFGTVMLFKGENGNKHCKWCHYLSCIPTSMWTC